MKKQLSFNIHIPEQEAQESTSQPTHFELEFPNRFIADVDSFLNYCSNTPISLTKTTKTFSRKHLQELNERLSVKAERVNAYSSQEFYPYIDFIYRLGISSRMLEMQTVRSTPVLRTTDRLTLFNGFSVAEKYCSLLETFWVDMDWDDLVSGKLNPVLLKHIAVFDALRHTEPGKRWNIVNAKTTIG